ncbi:MAG TPA: outer membrane protein assembly factor BamA [Syntrophales bacterium]|nr:outer membrane protein assembly factor BamA [Syntrophales bacterium]
MTVNKNRFLIKIIVLLASLLPAHHHDALAEELQKIAIMPFEIHARENAANLQESIYKGLSMEFAKSKSIHLIERDSLAKALGNKRIDESLALDVGKKTGADYVITGSLSAFGEQISVDTRVINVKEGKALYSVFAQGKGPAAISSISAQLRTNILLKIAAYMRIAKIEFKGNKKIESSALTQVIKSARGNLFSESELTSDVKAIYKMGYFDDVTADVTDSPEGKTITFILKEKALISEIRIKGNKAIERSEVEGALTFKVQQVLNPEKIVASAEKIKTLYDNKGYYNAEIKYTIDKEGEKNVIVTFNITENERLYVKSISFEGNQAFTSKELRNMMSLSEKSIFSFLTDSGILKKDQLKQDTDKITAFYLNHGFINIQIGEPEITHDKKGIYVKIPIVEGKQFKVGKVDITGDILTVSRSELLNKLSIRKKEFYDREAIMKDMEYLTQACNDDGFAYADVTPRTIPQEKTQTVDVTFNIKKGNEVFFNVITITGNTKTRDKVIRRQLTFNEGDLYSSSKLKSSYMALNRLRYFEEINFQTEKGPNESLTDVNINVKEKSTGMFSIGAGYSAQDGAIGTAQISQQNLFGRGQILSLKGTIGISGTTNMYELSFIEPWLFDIPLWSKFDLWSAYREYDSYNLRTEGFGMTFGYPLWPYVTGYVGYKLYTNDVTDVQPTAAFIIQQEAGKTTESVVSVTVMKDTTDDVMFPTNGYRNSASIDYAGGPLQGSVDYIRYTAKASWFHPLPLDTVFDVRGRVGFIQRTTESDVPIYDRYYLGGIDTLRGLRDVGPRDPVTNDPIGGFTMMCFNFEYVFPLIRNAGIKGVVFFDTGNAWDSGYHFNDLRKTAGVGIRWYSPIGPLRLEWGYVLDRKDDESPSRFEFTMGVSM